MNEENEKIMLNKYIKPHVLKGYRQMIGYSIDEVSKKTGIPKDRLERSENIEVELAVHELYKISNLYRIPLGHLFLDSVNEEYFLNIIKAKFNNPDDISMFLKFYRIFFNFIKEMISLGVLPHKDKDVDRDKVEYDYQYLLEKRNDLENEGIYVFYVPSNVYDYVYTNNDGYECYLVGILDLYKPEKMRDFGYMRYIFGDLFLKQLVQALDDKNLDLNGKIRLYNLLYNALELDLSINTYEYFDNMVNYFKVLYSQKQK
ncbi:MAG: helix-turn-helix transcriptional regulator [Candidatus Methanomethylicia archaeon]